MRNVILLFLLIVGWTTTVYAQNEQETIEVTGIVTDPKNEPLIGVNVTARNMPGFGAITDINGRYKIKVPNYSYLIFSYVGFTKQEIFIKDKKIINIVMAETKETVIDEVVVTGTGAQKKVTVTGAVTTVDVSQLRTPTASITNALAGNVAGILARQTSGQPGSNISEFWIRGISTFGAGGSALVLVDGFERDMNEINVEDIQDFSVLKDASATAIYGSRGANGVVLITTKRGKEGKTRVNAKVETSYNTRTRTPEFVDGPTYARMMNEALVSRSQAPAYSESDLELFANGLDQDLFPNVDWMNLILKDGAPTYRATVDLTGGGTVARYFISASYVNEGGMYETDRAMTDYNTNANYHRWNYRMNVDIDLTKSTLLKVGVSGSLDKQNLPGSQYHEIWHSLMGYSPIASPVQYSDGKWAAVGSEGRRNPWVLTTQQGYQETWKNKIQTTVNLEQDLKFITKGLKFYGRFGFDTYTDNGDNRFKWPESWLAERQRTSDGELQFRRIETQKLMDGTMYSSGQRKEYLEAELHYNRTFGDHMLGAVLKYSQDKTTNTSHNGNTDSYEKIVQSIQNRHQGFAGRFTYGWKYRYFFDFNFGYNGSERFDKSHRWGFFPSGGLGWVVSNEKFWADKPISKVVNMLKLKGSYGLVGNDNISNNDNRFFYLSEVNMNNSGRGMNFGTNFDEGYNGISISRYANPKIGWEISHKMNVGFELKLFNDLEIQAEYFKERRTNILQERADIPSLMGFQAPIRANIGEAKGQGVDISLDYSHIFNKNLWTTIRGNFTYASSEFSEYEEPDYSATPWRSKIGSKLSQTYGYIAERLFVDDEDVANSPKQQFGEYTAGDIKYKDINRDGIIDEQDIVPIGYPTTPEIIYGFGFSVGYKAFDFNCFFQGSARSSFFISPLRITPFAQPYDPDNELGGKQANNALLQVIADNHWSESNQNMYAFWPRLSDTAISNNNQSSTWWLRDGTFLRMKSAEIGYTLPKRLTSKAKLENLRIYVSGTNLFNISKFKIWDTEMGNNGLGYPVQRVFNVGIQLSL